MAIFGSINSFAKMVGYNSYLGVNDKKVEYVLYPKLHGTNASILIKTDGNVSYRSKNRKLSLDFDNASFMNDVSPDEALIAASFGDDEYDVTLWGEWIGQGIHKGSTDAACNIPYRVFVIFAIQVEDVMHTNLVPWENVAYKCGMRVLKPATHMTVDFSYGTDLTNQVNTVNLEVEKMETDDWFIRRTFNVSGTGEGVVGVPYPHCSVEEYFQYAFKAKTEAHRVKKTKLPATAQEPMPHEVQEFVLMMVTRQRIEQAVHETNSTYDMQCTPNILSWVAKDIQKEGSEEMAALDVEWKKIAKPVNHHIVNLWKELVNENYHSSYLGNAVAALGG